MNLFTVLRTIGTVFALLSLVTVFFYFGSQSDHQLQFYFQMFIKISTAFGIVSTITRYIEDWKKDFSVIFSDVIFTSYFLFLIFNSLRLIPFFETSFAFVLAAIILFVREFSTIEINYKRKILNPAQLFIISFMAIILLGAFALMLPKATENGIDFLDALFTSTSAVCVTGLSVVDTQTSFTIFGKTIIMVLIQIGGLGILTFASYFAYFFKGGTSVENTLVLGELANENKVGEVFKTVGRILILTLSIVLFGAIGIFFTVPKELFNGFWEQVFFSLFHSVSAFNNAGFSTLSNGLYDTSLRFNYSLHLIVAGLIIFGGIGFPIMFNVLRFIKYKVILLVNQFYNTKKHTHIPWVVNLNTQIILITTTILLIMGTLGFYFFEYNGVLKDHGPFGKWVTAFFGAVTPRTAGFNTVDMASLSFSTLMFTILLMWIGASPASTGGGIKTSTFAIATLNFISLAKGKDRIEINRREVADISIRRAFAIISLSLAVIGFAVLVLVKIEPDKDFIHLSFECFSAFSTVGLTINVTPHLGEGGKLVIIGLMFIGRVSTLTFLIAIIRKTKYKNYKYPKEEILIN